MKKISVLIAAVIVAIGAFAQENDTSLLRTQKVCEVKKYQLIHAFVGRSDTCLMEHHLLNEQALKTYEMKDYSCSGYKQKDETFSSYEGRQKTNQLLRINGDSVAIYSFEYERKSEVPSVSIMQDLARGTTTRTEFIYYKKKRSGLLDSASILVVAGDSIEKYMRKNTYDKKENLILITTQDEVGGTIAESVNEWAKNGQRISATNASFGEKTVFEQTFFTYDQYGRVVETNDTHNRQNIYLYTDSGLLKTILSYNAKGELEVEYIYTYTYRK